MRTGSCQLPAKGHMYLRSLKQPETQVDLQQGRFPEEFDPFSVLAFGRFLAVQGKLRCYLFAISPPSWVAKPLAQRDETRTSALGLQVPP